jgi:hypothetical protein
MNGIGCTVQILQLMEFSTLYDVPQEITVIDRLLLRKKEYVAAFRVCGTVSSSSAIIGSFQFRSRVKNFLNNSFQFF